MERMVGAAEGSIGDPAADTGDFYICPGIGHVIFHLFEAPGAIETGRAAGKNIFAAACQTRCDANRILFSDPGFHKLLRQSICKPGEQS